MLFFIKMLVSHEQDLACLLCTSAQSLFSIKRQTKYFVIHFLFLKIFCSSSFIYQYFIIQKKYNILILMSKICTFVFRNFYQIFWIIPEKYRFLTIHFYCVQIPFGKTSKFCESIIIYHYYFIRRCYDGPSKMVILFLRPHYNFHF